MSLPRPINWLRESSPREIETPSTQGQVPPPPPMTPIVKVFGEEVMVMVGDGVKEWVILVLLDRNPYGRDVQREEYETQSLETLVQLLNDTAPETTSQQLGAFLSYYNTNEYVGWNIPDFFPTRDERMEMDS